MTAREWRQIEPEKRQIVERHMGDIPVRLGVMARELGLTVKLSTMKPGESGQIRREDNGQYVVRINRHETRERQRFTLAHEIAHFLLHRGEIDRLEDGIVDNVLYRSGASEQKEYEANRLAADLIMPHDAVREQLDALGAPASDEIIDRLAEVFQVSRAAMEVRLSLVPT